MQTIYRVQRIEDGLGPYAPFHKDGDPGSFKFWENPFAWEIGGAHSWTVEQPGPTDDGMPSIYNFTLQRGWDRHVMRFGFDSLDKMEDWFGGWGNKLWESYHECAMYEVPEEFILSGYKQVAFYGTYARLIAAQDIREVVSAY